jgi:hypothetical protein
VEASQAFWRIISPHRKTDIAYLVHSAEGTSWRKLTGVLEREVSASTHYYVKVRGMQVDYADIFYLGGLRADEHMWFAIDKAPPGWSTRHIDGMHAIQGGGRKQSGLRALLQKPARLTVIKGGKAE